MIKPTIGRVVWYTPPVSDRMQGMANQPWPAFVSYVHSDTMINVAGFNSAGTPFSRASVRLLQDDDKARDEHEPIASWMPYQVAQAAKVSPPVDQPSAEFDLIGPLNEWGAHQILDSGIGPLDMWYYTLTGWDRATTDQQRMNIATQLGLDPLSGKFVPTGPPPRGFEQGQKLNVFLVELVRDAGPDGLGGRKRAYVDGHGANLPWLFKRKRIRARGITDIIAALTQEP